MQAGVVRWSACRPTEQGFWVRLPQGVGRVSARSLLMLVLVASLTDQCIEDPLNTTGNLGRSREIKILGLVMALFLFALPLPAR